MREPGGGDQAAGGRLPLVHSRRIASLCLDASIHGRERQPLRLERHDSLGPRALLIREAERVAVRVPEVGDLDLAEGHDPSLVGLRVLVLFEDEAVRGELVDQLLEAVARFPARPGRLAPRDVA
jgi:hypothetical protein